MKSKFIQFSKKILAGAALAFALVSNLAISASAESNGVCSYLNSETGYAALVYDGANYITEEEEKLLLEEMAPITEYTNVIYITDANNYACTESYSENMCESIAHSTFGDSANVVVYICDNEYDYIYSQGSIQKTISSNVAYTITDNIYKLSMDGEYYRAASKAFDQIGKKFQGKAIAEPMKYICNAIVALLLAFLINFLIVSNKSKLKRAGNNELIEGAISWVETKEPTVDFISESKTYSPPSSSGGGGHGGHGGGGHGGGGHSGGGHSH